MFILRNKSENMAQHWRSLFQFWQQFFIMLTHMWQEFSFFKFEPYLSARRPPSEPNPPGIDGAKPWCKRRPGSGWHIDICSHCNWWKLGAKRSTTWNASYISYHVYMHPNQSKSNQTTKFQFWGCVFGGGPLCSCTTSFDYFLKILRFGLLLENVYPP